MNSINGITKYFIERGLKLIPEPTDPNFLCVDDGGVEVETGEFIYGLIRRIKPQQCFSTGVYTGISDLYTAKALQDNGFGHLTAIEYEQYHIDRAQELWNKMGVFQQITVIKSDSMLYKPDKQFQFMFLDTELYLRFKELVRFYPNLDEGGYVFIHDMPRSLCKGNKNIDHPNYINWPVGEFPREFDVLLREDKLRMFHFMGARGMVGFYKPKKDDYKWK